MYRAGPGVCRLCRAVPAPGQGLLTPHGRLLPRSLSAAADIAPVLLTAPPQTASSSAAASSSTVLPISTAMIPTNISTSCAAFLNQLNTDTTFTSCMLPLANITALYNPVAAVNGTDAGISAASTITSTLTALCSSSSGCTDALIRNYLSSFYGACTNELADPTAYNKDVREIYDFLYVVNPFKGAVCSKDATSKKFCVLEVAASAANATASIPTGATNTTGPANSTSIASTLKSFVTTQDLFSPQVALAAANLVIVQTASTAGSLSRRLVNLLAARAEGNATTTSAIDSSTIITPNTTTYLNTGIAYLFLQPNMSSGVLCTSCTKSILASYVAWEGQVPYALGLASSPILGAQSALWSSVAKTCGDAFMGSITNQAGVLSANATANGTSPSSAGSSVVGTPSTMFGGAIGAAAVAVLASALL